VVEIFTFKLPSHDGVSAGLSGLSGVPGNKGLLVTASLEATGDVLNDDGTSDTWQFSFQINKVK